MLVDFLHFFILLLALFMSVGSNPIKDLFASDAKLKVSTYNLWNVMFNWDVRKYRIVQMIKEQKPDIIGFQEARGHRDSTGERNQVTELQSLLSQYRWYHYLPINTVALKDGVYKKEWELEGIGIMSRHLITDIGVQNLTYTYGPDTNRRAILHAAITVEGFGSVNVAVLHFSYDRTQQCGNAMELLQYVDDKQLQNVIAIGDYNTYKDFEVPQAVLEQSKSVSTSVCHDIASKYLQKFDVGFTDAWTSVHRDKKGLSFSNMPIPGLESRPDRILVAGSLTAVAASLTGNGSVYKARYFGHILWSRGESALWASYDAFWGYKGRSCVYDCGPHASCRCGVCVSGGDRRTCDLPDCDECDSSTFKWIFVTAAVFTLLAVQLLYSVLLVMLTMNERASSRKTSQAWFGNICICDPELYVSMSRRIKRRTRQSFLWTVWPFLRLPPMVLVLVTFGLIFISMEFFNLFFQELINDVYAIMPEELYPSDHLLLTVELSILK